MFVFKYINLTPHVINLSNGEEILPSGTEARVDEEPSWLKTKGAAIPVAAADVVGEVTGLPEPQEGTLYVVSRRVADATRREDLLVPATGPKDDPERNEKGQIKAVRHLKQVISSGFWNIEDPETWDHDLPDWAPVWACTIEEDVGGNPTLAGYWLAPAGKVRRHFEALQRAEVEAQAKAARRSAWADSRRSVVTTDQGGNVDLSGYIPDEQWHCHRFYPYEDGCYEAVIRTAEEMTRYLK